MEFQDCLQQSLFSDGRLATAVAALSPHAAERLYWCFGMDSDDDVFISLSWL